MRLKLSLLFVFIITYSWSQSGSTKTFTGNGTFSVPAGVTSIQVQAWGGGGSGGGAGGAPLLLGRGAAGGGGGAYASNTVLVTPGTTLNVVVASQTSGTTGAGAAGGNSTITGFESSILAAGGSGGNANNAGGSPLGGVGGTIAASAGSVRFAGANGGNGNSWNLLGLLLSSGAGGAGASSGGAGGTPVSGLIFSNAPGNAGSPPGGAGSGAINSALGASQIGGAGAAGRVIISYSCANFSLTSAAATSVCISAGTTATVTLTGSAASLPVGNYVVTYNRSSPSATALTANLTVSTAGTGTFTAVGLTTAGSSVITITKLASETCSSNISSNNTATVIVSPATVGGTVNGGTSICSGSPSGLLTLSGNTGSVVKWQSSVSPFTTWTDIANTTTTYTSGTLTATTQFRAVVKSGLCDAVNSSATTVTVNPSPTITAAASAQSACISPSPQNITLSYSGTTGSPTTYSIVWSSSPENSFEAITDAALSGSNITISVPAETAVGTYTGTLTVKNEDGCVSSGSVFTVTVKDLPSIGTFGTMYSVCTSTNAQTGSLEYSFASGNPTSYSINWEAEANAELLTDQPSTPFAFQESGGLINTIVIPANVPGGTYHGTLILSNGACLSSVAITLNVSPTSVGGTVTGGTSICLGNPSGELTLSDYTGSIINWQSSVSPFTTWTDIENTEPTYTSEALTETTQFRAVIQSGECDAVNSEATTVTVNPLPAIVLQQPFDLCLYNDTAVYFEVPFSGATGSPVSYSIVWDEPASSYFDSETDQELGENSLLMTSSEAVPVGIYTGTITVKNEMGCVSPGISFSINATQAPSISTTGTIDSVCESTTIQNASLTYSATTKSPTSYSVFWQSNLIAEQANTPFAFVSSGGVINTIQIPANTPAGTYTGILTINSESCPAPVAVSITISPPAVGGIVTGGTTIASGSTSGLLTLSGHTGTVVSWYSSVSPFTNWISIGNFNNTTYTSGPLTETTKFEAFVQSGNCFISEESGSTTVTVVIPPTITTDSSTTACLQDSSSTPSTSVPLSYSATTGSPVTYSIVWDSSPANNLAAVTDAALPASPIIIAIAAGTSFDTFTGTITVKDANGISSAGTPFSVKIAAKPTITTTGILKTACSRDSFQYARLAYSASTGNPTSYSVDWDDEAITDQPNSQFTFLPSGDILIVPIPANTPAGTYSGTMQIFNDASCSESVPVSLTIIPAIVGGAVTGGTTIASGSTSGLLTLSGHTGSVANWQSSVSPFTSWTNINNTNETYTSGPLTETTKFRAFVQNGICDAVNSEPTTVTVEDLPTIALATSAQDICSDGSISSTPLYYKGTTGSPVTYSIVWNSSPTNSFLDVTDATLPPNPIKIVIPAGTVAGIYTGTLTVKDVNGVSSIGKIFTVTIGVIPTIDTIGTIDAICSSTNLQNVTLSYASTVGDPTSYSIDWSGSEIEDQPNTSFIFSPSGGNIDTIVIPANVPAGGYSGIMKIYSESCSSEEIQIDIIINPTPTVPIVGEITPSPENATTGSVALSGLPSSEGWSITTSPPTITKLGSGESTVFTDLGPGHYTFTVNNLTTGCSSEPTEFTEVPTLVSRESSLLPVNGDGDLKSLKNPITVSTFNKVINVQTPNQIIDKVYIFNVSGTLIYEKGNVANSKLSIDNLRSSNQVLMVKVVLNNNQSETRKIIF